MKSQRIKIDWKGLEVEGMIVPEVYGDPSEPRLHELRLEVDDVHVITPDGDDIIDLLDDDAQNDIHERLIDEYYGSGL